MNFTRRQLIIAGALFVGLFIVLLVVSLERGKSNTGKTSNNIGGTKPSQDVINVVTQYVQSREDSVGVDQASPDSWLSSVKPITTSNWYTHLQPVQNSSTGTVPNDYRFAHNFKYIVKATVYNCVWGGYTKPTDTSGTVFCSLTDNVYSSTNGSQILPASLPFGWTHSGEQSPVYIKVILQGGSWLVDGDEPF